MTAAGGDPGIEIIVVDNGSNDGSVELARAMVGSRGHVLDTNRFNVGAVRNCGAAAAVAPIISFVDADCVVPLGYFSAVESVLERDGVHAAGCWVDYPSDGPWVERVWHLAHFRTGEGFRPYVNAASFAIRREVFEDVGGFDETLETGEDAEIGQRLNQRGYRVFESRQLAVVHIDNPRTLREFFEKEVWHGLGMFATARWPFLDRPTAMMFAHALFLLVVAPAVLIAASTWAKRAIGASACVLLVPVLSVAYRAIVGRRWVPIIPATVLYEVYYLARLTALADIMWEKLSKRIPRRRGI